MSITTVDTRNYGANDKEKVVFEAFDSLEEGRRMELINGDDPSSIYKKLRSERPNQFEWRSLEEGPELWKASIEKKYLNFI
jgi:uncharacterized protein (DUF2249 family)